MLIKKNKIQDFKLNNLKKYIKMFNNID